MERPTFRPTLTETIVIHTDDNFENQCLFIYAQSQNNREGITHNRQIEDNKIKKRPNVKPIKESDICFKSFG